MDTKLIANILAKLTSTWRVGAKGNQGKQKQKLNDKG